MRIHIRHETHYAYEEPVSYSIQTLKLTPRADLGQRIVSWRVTTPGERIEQVDPYGNLTHLVTMERPHREMRILVDGIVEIDEETSSGADESRLPPLAYLSPTLLTRAGDGIRELAARCLGRHPGSRSSLLTLAGAIREAVAYQSGVTDVTHAADEALALGVGVCQDQTHVLLACCRAAGIPARYVSGYLHTGEQGETASHAWADVWLDEEQCWVSLDVTHAEHAGARHCRLAVGRDYLDAAPVRGVRRGGGRESMTVAVNVTAGQANQQ